MGVLPRRRCKHCRGWMIARRIPADSALREVRIIRRSITLLTCPVCDTAPPGLDRESRTIHENLLQ